MLNRGVEVKCFPVFFAFHTENMIYRFKFIQSSPESVLTLLFLMKINLFQSCWLIHRVRICRCKKTLL